MQLLEDRLGGRSPTERLRVGVVAGDELIDALHELLDAGERAAADRLVGDQRAETFDLVQLRERMMRNKSALPSVRSPASPLWRRAFRPKVFHGTNSIICANSVLPTFMRHPGSFRPVSIAKQQSETQIVDTHEALETRVSIDFAAG
jgi:hypothetical protein